MPNPVAGGLQSPGRFTIAAWFRMDGTSSVFGTGSIANLRVPGNDRGFTLEEYFADPLSIMFGVNVSGNSDDYQQIVSTGWQFGEVYHVAATFNAGTGQFWIYRNGVPVTLQTFAPASMTTDPSMQFQIGRNIVNESIWDGWIDDVRFYDEPLDSAQVQSLVPEPAGIAAALVVVSAVASVRRLGRRVAIT